MGQRQALRVTVSIMGWSFWSGPVWTMSRVKLFLEKNPNVRLVGLERWEKRSGGYEPVYGGDFPQDDRPREFRRPAP